MDLESEYSVIESVEDNDEITNHDPIPENVGQEEEAKVVIKNGSFLELENNGDTTELIPEVKGNSPPVLSRGRGLRKWRRIKRDVNKGGGGDYNSYNVNNDDDTRRDMVNGEDGRSSSKRAQFYADERNQKSEEGSVSSTNAVFRTFDGFSHDDAGKGINSSFAAGGGTDSENSEDRSSSRSSTAASAPRVKYEKPVIRGRVEASKEGRGGGRIKIEKENSHSSVESDLRSFNFAFVQGTSYENSNNGIKKNDDYDDGEDGDEVDGNERQVNGDGSSEDQDLLTKSIIALQSAQEALEKEVLKFKEISEDASLVESLSDSEHQFPYGDDEVQSSSRGFQSEVVAETANREAETELENLFVQKIEAEVEYLTLSTTIQNMRVLSDLDQITVLEEQKALASEQTQILEMLGDAENKAAILKREAEKLENVCEDIASADEAFKLRKKVQKYFYCSVVQVLLFFSFLGVFIPHPSSNYTEFVPT